MYNVSTNVILYMIFGFIQKLLRMYVSFTNIFQGFCLDFKSTVFHQWLFPKGLTWHMKFLVRFVKAICLKFLSFYDGTFCFLISCYQFFKEYSDETLSILWKSAYRKNYEFLKWNNWKKYFFSIFNRLFFLFL